MYTQAHIHKHPQTPYKHIYISTQYIHIYMHTNTETQEKHRCIYLHRHTYVCTNTPIDTHTLVPENKTQINTKTTTL